MDEVTVVSQLANTVTTNLEITSRVIRLWKIFTKLSIAGKMYFLTFQWSNQEIIESLVIVANEVRKVKVVKVKRI